MVVMKNPTLSTAFKSTGTIGEHLEVRFMRIKTSFLGIAQKRTDGIPRSAANAVFPSMPSPIHSILCQSLHSTCPETDTSTLQQLQLLPKIMPPTTENGLRKGITVRTR